MTVVLLLLLLLVTMHVLRIGCSVETGGAILTGDSVQLVFISRCKLFAGMMGLSAESVVWV